jgi:Zn-dependent protease
MLDAGQIVTGLMWYVAFLFSTVCHEAAHAWAAMRLGDRTAYYAGQVTLSPFPHMQREPFGMLIMPWLSFLFNGWMMGWASAPYDPYWARRYPKRAAWMALAGPISNFLLATLAAIGIRAGRAAGAFGDSGRLLGGTDDALLTLLGIMFFLNVLLGAFNLLPLPPLDGFTAIGVLLPESLAGKLEEFRQTSGMFQILGLLLAWKMFEYVFYPIYTFASMLLLG